jgi:riboflavin biosynthesis pyrimidine reductase
VRDSAVIDREPVIRWGRPRETRFPFGSSPDSTWFEPIGFPPPWPDRPWIFGVMVASANGIVAWRRAGPADDPVLSVLGKDEHRPARIADRRHMRHLRCYGDVAIGAQTLREQPRLLQVPQEPDDPPMPALYRFRHAHGLPPQPRHVVYSLRGCLDPALPIFNTSGVEAIVVTTEAGAADLRACGAAARGVELFVDAVEHPEGLVRAHQRLFAERGVRYLACEGGQTALESLRRAGLLDEVFLTETDVRVDEARHGGILKIFDFEREGAELVADGDVPEDPGWRFRRWRFNRR